jgi:hypothetical protein
MRLCPPSYRADTPNWVGIRQQKRSWLYHSEFPQVEDVSTLQFCNVGFEELKIIFRFDTRWNHHDWKYVAQEVSHCSGHIAYHKRKARTNVRVSTRYGYVPNIMYPPPVL